MYLGGNKESHACQRQLAAVYRARRKAGASSGAAFVAAFREFERLHPETGDYAALAAVRDALSSEHDIGIVDC